jgi:hypothetical protein
MKSLKILVLSSLLLLSSCSTVRKSILYGGLSGFSLGVVGSVSLSPNKESVTPNIAVWGSIGALVGATLGYLFFMDDPENRELPSMINPKNRDQEMNPVSKLEAITIQPSDSKKYKVESGPLPENLKGKVKAPFIIEHEIPERIEQLENGKTITVEQHKAWEMSYE